jgi:hypothetical protein
MFCALSPRKLNLAGPQTCPLQCEAIHEHPCVLPNLWTNKIRIIYFTQQLTAPSLSYLHLGQVT